MTYPTVRRFSRTLAEAFPDERAGSGDWQYGFNTVSERGHRAVLWVSVVGLIGLAVAWVLT